MVGGPPATPTVGESLPSDVVAEEPPEAGNVLETGTVGAGAAGAALFGAVVVLCEPTCEVCGASGRVPIGHQEPGSPRSSLPRRATVLAPSCRGPGALDRTALTIRRKSLRNEGCKL